MAPTPSSPCLKARRIHLNMPQSLQLTSACLRKSNLRQQLIPSWSVLRSLRGVRVSRKNLTRRIISLTSLTALESFLSQWTLLQKSPARIPNLSQLKSPPFPLQGSRLTAGRTLKSVIRLTVASSNLTWPAPRPQVLLTSRMPWNPSPWMLTVPKLKDCQLQEV